MTADPLIPIISGFYAALMANGLAKYPGAPASAEALAARILSAPPEPTAPPKTSPLDEAGPLITCQEAAHRLGVTRRSITNYVNAGLLPLIRLRRTVRIPESAIADLIKKKEIKK